MKHRQAIPTIVLAGLGLLTGCGGRNDNPEPAADAFVAGVSAVAAPVTDDSDPVNVDPIAITSPEDADAQALS
jgi:hypothetical protein